MRASPSMRAPRLVAVAHGSRDPRAAATVEALMRRVRLARPEIDVRTAYLDHAAPSVGQVLDQVDGAVVLPLLLTAAYHSRVDIPAAVREARRRNPGLRVRYGETLGPDPALIEVLERRLADAGVGATGADPDTGVVLVSAGSSDARANAVISRMAADWAARGRRTVVPAYASAAAPSPEEAVARLRAAGVPRVVVAPYLLAPGCFADRVREESLAAGADAVADVLGPAPQIAEIVCRRYAEAVATPLARSA